MPYSRYPPPQAYAVQWNYREVFAPDWQADRLLYQEALKFPPRLFQVSFHCTAHTYFHLTVCHLKKLALILIQNAQSRQPYHQNG